VEQEGIGSGGKSGPVLLRVRSIAMRNIKTMVKDKVVRFKFYREGELFYETECGFVFPVPLADVGNATFMAEDKALLFMRYIRKHLVYLEKAREAPGHRNAD
jgi:hypothetical protein